MSAFPTGTVTFLFADVEGSTRLARELDEAGSPSSTDLRRLLREAVAGADGHEVDSRGDELFAVFTEPRPPRRLRSKRSGGSRATTGPRRYASASASTPARLHSARTATSASRCTAPTGSQTPATAARSSPRRRRRSCSPPAASSATSASGRCRSCRSRSGSSSSTSPASAATSPRCARDPAQRPCASSSPTTPSCSAKASHGCSTTPASTSWRSPATPTTSSGTWRCTSRTWRWWTSGCRRRRRTRGCARPRRSASVTRRSACSCSRSTSSRATRWSSSPTARNGVGYLLKDRVADIDEFAAAVRRVSEGGSALDPAVVSQLVGRHRRDDPLADLSPREREVLELMAEGRSNQAIAERLFVTLRAVEKHVTSIFVKLRLTATPGGSPPRARRTRPAPRLDRRRIPSVTGIRAGRSGKNQGRPGVMPDTARAAASGSSRGMYGYPHRKTLALRIVSWFSH